MPQGMGRLASIGPRASRIESECECGFLGAHDQLMSKTREYLRNWTEQLLEPAGAFDRQRAAAYAWCDWALAALEVNEPLSFAVGTLFSADTGLATGKAISPLAAARCVREHRRTAVFLQAMDAAIREARVRFPGETIRVLEAGCGPLAPLALPFALRYGPDEVTFTLLDLHPLSLEGARKLAKELGVEASLRDCLCVDATQVKFAEASRPHIIACEVLLRALKREPQVAATVNLAPQVRPGGFFLPEKIAVDAGLLDFAKYDRLLRGETSGSAAIELGRVFCLEAGRLDTLCRNGETTFAAGAVRVPPHGPRTPLHLFTRIQVFRDHRLGDFDSSLNLPERVKCPATLGEKGGLAEFFYEISADPGLRLR